MKVCKYTEFNESNLKITDLEKRSKEGGLRGDVLVKKINLNDPVTIDIDGDIKDIIVTNSDEIVNDITDKKGKYDPESGQMFFKPGRNYDDVIDGNDGETYKLNDIKKTPEFGSSRGSSLGAKSTREVETLQCLVLSYRQQKGSEIDRSDLDSIILADKPTFWGYLNYVGSTIDVTQELLEEYASDWGMTFIKTANALYQKRIRVTETNKESEVFKSKIEYKFYQISSKDGVCGAIKNAYSNIEGAPNMSKWNPSDIWAVDIKSEEEIISKINTHQSITGLNSIIDSYFDTRKLIGISLKKVVKDEPIKLVINKLTRPPRYKFHGIKLAEDAFSTSSLRIEADRKSFVFGDVLEYMTVRSFAGQTIENISGEIVGKAARQGKVSLTKINKILLKHIGEEVPTKDEINEWDDEELSEQIEAINDMITRRYGNVNPTGKAYEINRSRLTSKYQALYLAWIFLENENKKKFKESSLTVVDQVVEEMFHYALSIRFGSRDADRTPKYVRIVD